MNLLYPGVCVCLLILLQVVLPSKAQSCGNGLAWFDTRLVGGERYFEGRVEIFLNNSWMSLCDMEWDRVKADLVCGSLGYGYAVSVVTGSGFGPGTGAVYPPLIRCSGDDRNLGCCSIVYNINGDQCTNSREAGVVCSGSNVTQGSLRFAGSDSSPYQGRLEMYNGSQWGTICYSGWTAPDARVACSQMMFPGVVQTLFYTTGGGSSQPIWFSDVLCGGNESSLLQCGVNRNHLCTHATDVGVKCSLSADTVPTTPMNIGVRLAGGRNDYQGRVEVYRDNQWKLVCGSTWDQSEGDVVCRQLGFGYAVATTSENTIKNFLKGSGSVWSASINCVGSERTLGECSVTQPATSSCALNNSVSVFCSGRHLASGSIRFVSSYFIDSVGGRLEVFLNNEWGTVCDTGWDGNDALVACKDLGFLSVDRESGTQGSGYMGQKIWMKNVDCRGTESQLVDCNYTSGEDCDHFFHDIAISCFNTVLYSLRLVGGRNRSEGYVQIFGRSWTSICNDDFDMIDAAVACKDLGYNYATAVVYDGRFSRDELGTGYPWTVSFDCSGNEQRLYACPRRFSPGCRTENELVGVVCSQTSGGTTGTMGPSVIGAPSDNAAALLGGIVGGVVGGVFLLMLVVVIVVIVITVSVCLCTGGHQSTPNYNTVQMSYKM